MPNGIETKVAVLQNDMDMIKSMVNEIRHTLVKLMEMAPADMVARGLAKEAITMAQAHDRLCTERMTSDTEKSNIAEIQREELRKSIDRVHNFNRRAMITAMGLMGSTIMSLITVIYELWKMQ